MRKRYLMAAGVVAIVSTSGQACWRPGAIRQVIAERRAVRQEQRPLVTAVRDSVPVRVVGEVLNSVGNVVTGYGTAIRGCVNGTCQ